MADDTEDSKDLRVPGDGSVKTKTVPNVTEREIRDELEMIQFQLHTQYADLTDYMRPFQEAWDANPMGSVADALFAGAADGIVAWGEDFEDMFTAAFWSDVGDSISEAAGAVYDTAGAYAVRFYNGLREDLDEIYEVVENADETLLSWSWWKANIEEIMDDMEDDVVAKYNAVAQLLEETADAISETVEGAEKLYKYRKEILNLPTLIANGDPKPIEHFVDVILMDIDEDLAWSIKQSKQYYLVLELVADHDSILMYMSYISLTIEAVPPNFYAYVAGKGGAYVLVEVVLLIVTAILTAGTATAARIGTLLARLAVRGAGAANTAKKLHHAEKAYEAFGASIQGFGTTAKQLHGVGDKLLIARQRGLVLTGGTRSTIAARRQLIKREPKCLICGSTKHKTPRRNVAIGDVDYDL